MKNPNRGLAALLALGATSLLTAQATKAAAATAQADAVYQQSLDAINAADYAQALAQLKQLQALKYSKPDAVDYWQAYAQDKMGQYAASMATLAAFDRDFAASSWANDAKALQLEIQQQTGQPVSTAAQGDDDLKLLAINGLMQADPAQAVPMLQKVVAGNNSPKVKDRALFVMAQNKSPEAQAALLAIANNAQDPQELRFNAVRYLGMMGGSAGRDQLASIYTSTSDAALKKQILASYMQGRDTTRLLAVAQNEKDPELRTAAVRYLGMSGGGDQLWQLYQSSSDDEMKKSIIDAFQLSSGSPHLLEIARGDKSRDLRLEAIRILGVSGKRSGADGSTMASLYAGAQDKEISEAVLRSLRNAGDADDLVSLAKKETDGTLKRDIVQMLSTMHSKAATDYLLTILNGN